jgi:hypothetical protein
MQSALRAIVLLAGLLMLVASAITFGNAEPAAAFAGPAGNAPQSFRANATGPSL